MYFPYKNTNNSINRNEDLLQFCILENYYENSPIDKTKSNSMKINFHSFVGITSHVLNISDDLLYSKQLS